MKSILIHEIDANLAPESIAMESSLLEEGLGLDSISIVNFICLLEEHFGFEFDEAELDVSLFSNLGTLCEFIANKLGGAIAIDDESAIPKDQAQAQ